MNRIYWQTDRIGMLTDHLNANKHTHWMLQLFLSLDGLLEVSILEEKLACKCIVVDKNTPHSIDAKQKRIFSILIAPTSSIAEQLSSNMNSSGFWVCDTEGIIAIQQEAQNLAFETSIKQYLIFCEKLYHFLNITPNPKKYDSRIDLLLHLIENCKCGNHVISNFAKEISLSSSRLSHLFKEQTGIPLKSFIVLHQVERAFTELLNGKSITAAAMEAGFDSPSHFAATVKRMMGMPASLSTKDSEFLKVHNL